MQTSLYEDFSLQYLQVNGRFGHIFEQWLSMCRFWTLSPQSLGQITSTNWQSPLVLSVCESSSPNPPIHPQPQSFMEQYTFSPRTCLFCFLSSKVANSHSLQNGQGLLSVMTLLMQLWQKCCPQQLVRVGSRVTSRQTGHSKFFNRAAESFHCSLYPPVYEEAIFKALNVAVRIAMVTCYIHYKSPPVNVIWMALCTGTILCNICLVFSTIALLSQCKVDKCIKTWTSSHF